jgi:cell division protein ZapA
MPLVNVMVNGRAYTIACDDGEEDHLRELAAHVDAKVRELLESVGQVGDLRILLMAALLVTDEYFEARQRLELHRKQLGDLAGTHEVVSAQLGREEEEAAASLETGARRMRELVAALAEA